MVYELKKGDIIKLSIKKNNNNCLMATEIGRFITKNPNALWEINKFFSKTDSMSAKCKSYKNYFCLLTPSYYDIVLLQKYNLPDDLFEIRYEKY